MSTFLQLAARLRQEVGDSGTGPIATSAAILNLRDWLTKFPKMLFEDAWV